MVTKRDIARQAAASAGISVRMATDIINTVLVSIRRAVGSGQKVELRNFGVFRPRYTRERISGFHAKTGAPLSIPASVRFSFKTARSLKNLKIGG